MDRRLLAPSLLFLACAALPAAAGVHPVTGELPQDIVPMVAAEQKFCARAKETSIRDAFNEAIAPEGIVFRGGPVNGKEFFRDRPSNPGPLLHWEPSYAEISAYGDLGWTTGPWEYTNAGESKPSAFGHFATVWQLGVDHKWHFLVDFGCTHAQGAPEERTWARIGGDKVAEHLMTLVEFTTSNRSFMHADSAYSTDLATGGLAKALAAWGDADVRVYRDDHAPLVGVAAASQELAHEWDHGAVAWGMHPGAMSKSGDLAFSYGTVDLPAGKKGEPTRRNIMRIWRRSPGEDWRLALDVTNAAAPAPAAQAAAAPAAPEPPKKP